jgi:hypothetical protein
VVLLPWRGAVLLRGLLLGSFVAFLAPAMFAGSEVGVYLEFEQRPSEIVTENMKREAADLLRPAALEIAWRLVSENQGDESFERLAVVKFTGTCACKAILQRTREILILGSTAVASGQVLPYSQVRCDQLRRLLPEDEFAPDRRRGDAALGRALGRVLAHELYHVLLGTTHHTATGVAKALQSTEDLKSEEVSFEQVDWTPLHTIDTK